MADTNQIIINVELDENKFPKKMTWTSGDSPTDQPEPECKAMLLSLFDKDYKDTYRIDLWTNEMQIPEMDMFMYYTLKGLADTYFNATRNTELASAMRQLADYMAEKNKLFENNDLPS
ncbi:MAG TPA: gliding motility protein GldC [Saprospiraceae bacterium]|mgnify:FL=1|nr:gliding motility protein GldC [Saprospiraceae bacterium]